jgi:isopentenyl-diphosphate Delta-isomerase
LKEELVDILDEQGNQTGQSMLKSEAHAKGLWHGGAHIWIYNSNGEVLMQLRSPKKIVTPNIWDVSVAGHIQAGKTPKETVVEEAQEELGLEVNPSELQFIGNTTVDMQEKGWRHRVWLWVYALKQDNLDPASLTLEEAETADVKWIPLERMARDLKDPSKTHLYSPQPTSCYVALAEIPKLLSKGARTE